MNTERGIYSLTLEDNTGAVRKQWRLAVADNMFDAPNVNWSAIETVDCFVVAGTEGTKHNAKVGKKLMRDIHQLLTTDRPFDDDKRCEPGANPLSSDAMAQFEINRTRQQALDVLKSIQSVERRHVLTRALNATEISTLQRIAIQLQDAQNALASFHTQ